MKFIRTFEAFNQPYKKHNTAPQEEIASTTDDKSDLDKKKKEDEESLNLEVDPALKFKLDSMRK